MNRTNVVHPYEFLVRFREGKISGMHVQYIEHVYEGDKHLFHHVHDPQPVTEDGKFPLSGILEQIHISALATVQALQDELKTAKAEILRLQSLPPPENIVDIREEEVKLQS